MYLKAYFSNTYRNILVSITQGVWVGITGSAKIGGKNAGCGDLSEEDTEASQRKAEKQRHQE